MKQLVIALILVLLVGTHISALAGGVLGISGSDWHQQSFSGVEIQQVSEGSSASLAGLRKGDVITEINGRQVRSNQDLSAVLAQLQPGSKVRITYIVKTNLGWIPKETAAILAADESAHTGASESPVKQLPSIADAAPDTSIPAAHVSSVGSTSWLFPTEVEYQRVVDSIFGKLKLGKKEPKPLYFRTRLESDMRSYIEVQPPLYCAVVSSDYARRRLEPAPTVDSLKSECDGVVSVVLHHYSRILNPDRPLVVDYQGQRLKPDKSDYDHSPDVTTYNAGLLASNEVGYSYIDVHKFVLASPWAGKVTFVTADPLGKQSTFTYDFSLLVQNEAQLRDVAGNR